MKQKRNKYQYDEKKILELFDQGYNSVQIAEYFKYPKRTYSTISQILKRNNRVLSGKRLQYSQEDENRICQLYQEGYTQIEILDMFDSINCEGTIHQILKKHNISKRSTGTRSAIKNHDYFENIDTEKKAYFLGLLMADGCVMESKKGKVVNFGLKESDKYLIDEFANEIGFNGKLHVESAEQKTLRSGFASTGFVSIRFVSEKMVNDLNKYGIVPRKTGKEYVPENISEEFLPHFIRGCFDGDGSAFVSQGYFRISYYGSHKICQDILDVMQFDNKVYDKTSVSFFSIQRKEYIKQFYDFIYKNATIYMHRKKDLFEKYMQR